MTLLRFGAATAFASALCATAFAPVPAAAAASLLARPAPATLGIAANVARVGGVLDRGRMPAMAPVRVGLVMRDRHESEIEPLAYAQGDKLSPYYHRYLTNAQWNAYFAPSQRDYDLVISRMSHAGFRIDHLATNRGIVVATAPARVAERYFHTVLHRVVQDAHGERYANIVPGTLPGELRGLVVSVAGLHDVAIASYPHRIVRPAARAFATRIPAATATAKPITNATPPPNPNPEPTLPGGATNVRRIDSGGYGPVALANAYDYPVQHGYSGVGRNTGNVISGDFVDSDLAAELNEFGIKRLGTTTRVFVDGTFVTSPTSADAGESTLDVEAIVGLAPGTNYYEYLIPILGDVPIADAYNRVVADNIVDAVNSSFGGCETADPVSVYATDYIAMQGAVKGITFAASTGDTGSQGCGVVANGAPGTGPTPSVESPSSGNYFTGVGGTDLFVDLNGNFVRETGWETGGGGISAYNPLPSWQSTTAGVATTGRNVPDVALDASLETGFNIYQGGNFLTGGTSLASPLFIALQTEIDEVQHSRNGWVNPRLYEIVGKNGYGTQIRDVVGGTNGAYTAVPGYDRVTGLGSPLGFGLAGTE